MPKIIGKNGTSVNVICADLTTLVYLRDSDTWKCEYSDWAFGLFAICSVVALLLPLLLIIYCCIKYNHKHSKLHHIPEYSRQTSYSSVYPEQNGRDLHTFPEDETHEPDVHHHQPKRIGGKLYFPYPAYGTFDEASLPGSTSTLYQDIPTTQQNAISNIPAQQQAQLVPPLDPNQPFILHLSSSAPIVTSMLRDTRQYLHESHNSNSNLQDNNSLHGINKNSHNSLNDFKEHNEVNSFRPSVLSTSSSTGSPIYIKHKNDGLPPAYTAVTSQDEKQNVGLLDQRTNQGTSLSSTNSSFSCNRTEKPSSTEGYNANKAANAVGSNSDDISKPLIDLDPETTTVDSNINNDLTKQRSDEINANINENIQIPVKTNDRNDSQIDDSLNKSNLADIPANPDRLLDDCEKNRILSATPNKNMISRQDFDDYLADCVLKLPEDQRNGTFLIRNSTSTPNCKVLTLYCKSIENSASLFYFKITYTDSNMMYIENTEKMFSALEDLIAFHKINRSVLPCLLGDCLGKNF